MRRTSTKNSHDTSAIEWSATMLFAVLGAIGTAVVGVAMYQRDSSRLDNPEAVFISLGRLLFHPFVAGFMLAAILAAIMSTISSQLLVTSSALVEDLHLIDSAILMPLLKGRGLRDERVKMEQMQH